MSEQKPISEQINLLIQLQELDREIYALRREELDIPKQIEKLDKSLEDKRGDILNAENRLKELQLKLKDKEGLLQQKEEQITKLQIQLYQLKTNKEYSAMLAEISSIKADNSLIEDEIIKLMDDIEVAKKRVSEAKELFKQEELKVNGEKEKIHIRLGEIGSRLSELERQREGITSYVDKQILARYEKILKNKDGLALVKIEGGICGGCHMNLPPQVISEVKMREEIIVCGSCLRILYIEDNVEIN